MPEILEVEEVVQEKVVHKEEDEENEKMAAGVALWERGRNTHLDMKAHYVPRTELKTWSV